ncbi:MAG: HutD family protein [Methylotenera sp.]|nr:HutD family protein [Oligoflexia bacterium]
MASSHVLAKTDYRRATWKNGLGYTDEIAIYPAGSELKRGNFLWRLSSARIEQASPFSAFPEHDRVLIVLKGAGVRLTHTFDESEDPERVDVPLLSPYEFPGDVPSKCELLQGPITDLSVFVRKAEAEAVAEVVEVTPGEPFDWLPAGRWNFAFAVQGSFEITTPDGMRHLDEGDTLQLELSEPLAEDAPVQIQAAQSTAGKLVIIGLQG